MADIFLEFVNRSIVASWLILAVIVLRLILKKAPKWIPVFLWGLVAVRLACPLTLESGFSLVPDSVSNGSLISGWTESYVGSYQTFFDNTEEYKTAVSAGRKPFSTDNKSHYVVTASDGLSEPATVDNTVIPVLSVLWVIGIAVLVLYTMISYLNLRRRMQTAVLLHDNIFQSEQVSSPFVLGLLRPRIYLPFGMSETERTYVIAHETSHIKRLDHWIKPLGFVLLTLYWFNPMIWIFYVLLCRDIEFACDETVIKRLMPQERADYSQTLLCLSAPRRKISACPLAFGEISVKERVSGILHYKKPAFWLIALAVLSCVIFAVCFLTAPKGSSFHKNPFGHTYRVESIVYDAAYYNFSYTPKTAPFYNLLDESSLLIKEDKSSDQWLNAGALSPIELTEENFDNYFKIDEIWRDTSADKLRKENKSTWCATVSPELEESVFYYVMQQKNGEIYLAYGYSVKDTPAESSIRWIFKLTRYDLLECHAVSDGFDYYLIPDYYPDGFNYEYGALVYGDIKDSGNLVFDAQWDTDTLAVEEDYYTYEGSIGTVIRNTYELKREESGKFTLPVARKNFENEEEAVYFVKGETGTYVFRILFPTEELPVKIPESKIPDSVLSDAILDRNKLKLLSDKPIIEVESHILFGEEVFSGTPSLNSDEHAGQITVYALVMTQAYTQESSFSDELQSVSGSCVPTALTFSVEENNTYALEEYWIPHDGDRYPTDVSQKFPAEFAVKALRAQDYIEELKSECEEKARNKMLERPAVMETTGN